MNGSSSAGPEVEYSPRQSVSAPPVCGEIPSGPGGGEPASEGTPTASQWMNAEFEAEFERQHRNCRRCHPELGRDYVRAAATLGALSLSLVAWIVGITLLATRWN